jgi:predicted nucleic acid-binding protein
VQQSVAVLDANVLIPAAPRDTLLRAAEAGLYQLRWSENILDEVYRNLVEHRLTTADDARNLLDVMRSFFPEALVSGYDHLMAIMTNDLKDHHVLAAAVHTHADIIVTENFNDFPAPTLSPYGIEAQAIDTFLVNLHDRSPASMARIIREQAADLDYPPMTPAELLDGLESWASAFVQRIRQHI